MLRIKFPGVHVALAKPGAPSDVATVRRVQAFTGAFSLATSNLNLLWVAVAHFEQLWPPRPEADDARGIPYWEGNALRELYAIGFVHGLHMVGKGLVQLSKLDDRCTPALEAFEDRFPRLKDLRDSIAHADERAQRRNRNKQIKPQPGIVHGDGAMVLGGFRGRHYVYTAFDGADVELEINVGNATFARDRIQDAIEALPWVGHERWHPQ